MAIIITFTPIAHAKPEEDLEWIVLEGKTGDILLRETMEDNLEGYPEVSIVGFPIGLQSAGALGGGITGLKQALADKKVTAGGLARRGGGYALAGALAGKLSNEIIASGNRPRYPSTLQYYGW